MTQEDFKTRHKTRHKLQIMTITFNSVGWRPRRAVDGRVKIMFAVMQGLQITLRGLTAALTDTKSRKKAKHI